LFARHDELRQRAGDQTEHDPRDDTPNDTPPVETL
jgi:hypothetical protein